MRIEKFMCFNGLAMVDFGRLAKGLASLSSLASLTAGLRSGYGEENR
jgi:hypothetical protein